MSESKHREVLKTLLRKTNAGELNWSVASAKDKKLANERYNTVGPIYSTQYKGRTLILAGIESERTAGTTHTKGGSFSTLPGVANIAGTLEIGPEKVSRAPLGTSRSIMILKNPNTGGIWYFPASNLLDDLLESVRKQTSKVNEWVDDVLDE